MLFAESSNGNLCGLNYSRRVFSMIPLLIAIVTATDSIAAQWRKSLVCDGPPQLMYIFDNELETKKSEIYTNFEPLYPETRCGWAMVPFAGDCCYSSLDSSSTAGYLSGFVNPDSDFPASANGNYYCHVELDASIAPSMGYNELYILNDGSCAAGKFKCSNDGLVSVYLQDDCQGDLTVLQSPSTSETFEFGTVKLTYLLISTGNRTAGWTTSLPEYMMVPLNIVWYEILLTIMVTLATIMDVVSVIFAALDYAKNRRSRILILLITQFLWLATTIMYIIYTYGIFPDYEVLNIYSAFYYPISNLAKLFSCIYTTEFFFSVNPLPTFTVVATYTILGVAHIVLLGTQYVYYWSLTYEWDGVLVYSEQGKVIWMFGMFLWNLATIVMIAWKATAKHSSTFKSHLYVIYSLDRVVAYLLLLQVFIIVLNVAINFVVRFTAILGSDRTMIACEGIVYFCLPLHSILNLVLIEKLKTMIKTSQKLSAKNVLMNQNDRKKPTKRSTSLGTKVVEDDK